MYVLSECVYIFDVLSHTLHATVLHVSFATLFSPQSGLHSILWSCRYVCAAVSLTLYVWEWYHFLDYGERNYHLLSEILQLMKAGSGSSVHPDSGNYDERIRTGASKVCGMLVACVVSPYVNAVMYC